MIRSTAISNFLNDFGQHYIKYTPELEVQVNGISHTNTFRIPKNAKTEPTDNDINIGFSLDSEALAIGCTGWDWKTKKPRWVGYDLDSIMGHKQGIESDELSKIIKTLSSVDFITIVRSTSGNGYHLYVHIDPSVDIVVANHSEHIALARSILDEISGLTGLELESKVDTYGTILWLWHRNQTPNAFETIKEGNNLRTVPNSWRDYIKRRRGYRASFADNDFSHDATKLDSDHIALIKWLGNEGYSRWWDQDRQLLVCHTHNLKQAHKELKLDGFFDTVATGASGAGGGTDHNCFAVPIENGAWIVRRFTRDTQEETGCWFRDRGGYSTCYYNTVLPFDRLGDMAGASRISQKGYRLTGGTWLDTLRAMGLDVEKSGLDPRPLDISRTPDNTYTLKIKREENDDPHPGWFEAKGYWTRIVDSPNNISHIRVPHDKIRHVASNGKSVGWFVKTDRGWTEEPKTNVTSYLRNEGNNPGKIEIILGKSIKQHWTLVNEPFQPQYLAKRQWNKSGAQLAYEPRKGDHPTWDLILTHLGQELNLYLRENTWARSQGVYAGHQYLLLWISSLFQNPKQPLPFIFLYGPQNSGKSTLHESLGLLFRKRQGYVGAKIALISQSEFNEELAGGVLCYVEEVNLGDHKAKAYNRIKHWVTAVRFTVHPKGQTPYDIDNTTHWIQCSNYMRDCPILPGDTRITAIHVPELKDEINKDELLVTLAKEAPAFLYTILNLELPKPTGRLGIPVVETGDRETAIEHSQNNVEAFIAERCFYVPGEVIKFGEFYERFQKVYEGMSKIAVSRLLPPQFPRGYADNTGQLYIGNISWEDMTPTKPRYQRIKGGLKPSL